MLRELRKRDQGCQQDLQRGTDLINRRKGWRGEGGRERRKGGRREREGRGRKVKIGAKKHLLFSM